MRKKGYISNSFVTWAKRRNIPVTYETVVLVPYYDGYKNVLTQDMINEENTKYVIKYDYWLNGETITVPENSILEFDGGTLYDGTIIGQNTFINDIGGLGLEKLFAEDIIREGTWRTNGGGSFEQVQSDWNQTDASRPDFIKHKPDIPEGVIVDTALSKTSTNPVQNKVIAEALENAGGNPDKPYDPEAHSGLGRKTLQLKDGSNILTQEDFNQENTIYVIQYDFTLGEDITVPANCVLEFDGGSINGSYSLTLTNTSSIKADNKAYIFKGVNVNGINWFSVCWFGAKGNGEFDNTSIFQNILTRNYGEVAFFPQGEYVITSYIDASNIFISWIGEPRAHGRNSKLLWNDTSVIRCKGELEGKSFAYLPFRVENISFLGDYTIESDGGWKYKYIESTGIQIGKPGNFSNMGTYKDIAVYCFGTGAEIQNAADVKLTDCCFARNYHGIDLSPSYVPNVDSGYSTLIVLDNCVSWFNYGTGLIRHRRDQYVNRVFCVINGGFMESNNLSGNNNGNIYITADTRLVLNDIATESTNFIRWEDTDNRGYLEINGFKAPYNGSIYTKGVMVFAQNIDAPQTDWTHRGPFNISMYNAYLRKIDIAQIGTDIPQLFNVRAQLVRDDVATNNRYITQNSNLNVQPNEIIKGYTLSINTANGGYRCAVVNEIGIYGADGRKMGKLCGDNTERPTPYAADKGYAYFDTSLGKPIFWNGSAWVDATGATV